MVTTVQGLVGVNAAAVDLSAARGRQRLARSANERATCPPAVRGGFRRAARFTVDTLLTRLTSVTRKAYRISLFQLRTW
jgi:hypothetical protein